MKVCFWGNIAHTLKGETDGGGELQIGLLAKALVKGGNEVVIIDYNTREDFVTEDGIKVIQINDWEKGIPIIRYVTNRIPMLYRTLRDQRADVYYCRIREFRHIIAYWAARKVKAKFILGMASDLDVMSFRTRIKNYYVPQFRSSNFFWWLSSGIINEFVFPWLLRKSDAVFVQHEGQKKILNQKGIRSILFSNLIDLSQIPEKSNGKPADYVYVGSLDRRKGFGDFFNVIEKAPGLSFKVVGQPRDKPAEEYFEKLRSYPNVKLLGKLPHADTIAEIATSKALVSTSPMEGFPNIFIEAWACGIPVYSLYVDPGGIIARECLGKVANGDIDLLISMMAKNNVEDGFSSKARSFVFRNFGLSGEKIDWISSLFKSIVSENGKKKE
jgi:glycosyltransferase involved in cell wall biosynthesis